MKIKSIAAICKKNKQVVLFNRYGDSGTISQYIGDGSAVYPISGLPELDEESILTIFDVPEKQREDWLVRYRDIPEGISFEDTDATEKIIEQGNLSIVYSGKTLKPLQTRRGLVFIESRYLSPVSDVLDVLELYERVTPFGAPYIVAKAGFLLQAVIMPCDVISAQFVQRLQELTRQCAVSLDLREQERPPQRVRGNSRLIRKRGQSLSRKVRRATMIRTQRYSRFVLMSLDEIHATRDIVLQTEETKSNFSGSGKTVYICEVVRPCDYQKKTDTAADKLAAEIERVNADNRALRRKVERLERELQKARAGA